MEKEYERVEDNVVDNVLLVTFKKILNEFLICPEH